MLRFFLHQEKEKQIFRHKESCHFWIFQWIRLLHSEQKFPNPPFCHYSIRLHIHYRFPTQTALVLVWSHCLNSPSSKSHQDKCFSPHHVICRGPKNPHTCRGISLHQHKKVVLRFRGAPSCRPFSCDEGCLPHLGSHLNHQDWGWSCLLQVS